MQTREAKNAADSENASAIKPVSSGAGARGNRPKNETAEIAAPAERPGRRAASAKPHGTIAPVPTPRRRSRRR